MSAEFTPPTRHAQRYCERCWYSLRGLNENRCPECGQGFDPDDPSTFRTSARRQNAGTIVVSMYAVSLIFTLVFWASLQTPRFAGVRGSAPLLWRLNWGLWQACGTDKPCGAPRECDECDKQ